MVFLETRESPGNIARKVTTGSVLAAMAAILLMNLLDQDVGRSNVFTMAVLYA
jgi:hypothetical protein